GANTDNIEGIAGVCWRAKVMPIKVANAWGSARLFDISQGIYYAVDNGAKVVNLSLGATIDQQSVRDAVEYAYSHNVVLVGASGNSESSGPGVNYLYYPAAYESVIAVGATNTNDEVADLSNSSFISHRGGGLDIVAPGVEIIAATRDIGSDVYARYDGTSMSVPQVVGAVALLLSVDNTLGVDEITQLLHESAEKVVDMTGDFDTRYGYGRLDVDGLFELLGQDSNDNDGDSNDGGVYGDNYLASWQRQSNYWFLRPGEKRSVWVEFKNEGDALWEVTGNNAVHMATSRYNDRSSAFYDSASWLTGNRIEMSNIENVAPGEIARFEFDIVAPMTQGEYKEYFGLVTENKSWMNDMGVFWEFNVTSQDVYSGVWYDKSDYLTLDLGDTSTSWIEFLNNGTADWDLSGAYAVHLGTDRPLDRSSDFYDSDSWLSNNRVELDQTTVVSGEVGRFTFDVKPAKKGFFREYFRMVVENMMWLEDWGVFLQYQIV
ncbi:S8 family serine peptidase, partial [Patescibacteria group bacterium]|nr:S8 family serine peptidase [Patescibacteria group bacterium]